jgi:hypothetical protein
VAVDELVPTHATLIVCNGQTVTAQMLCATKQLSDVQ